MSNERLSELISQAKNRRDTSPSPTLADFDELLTIATNQRAELNRLNKEVYADKHNILVCRLGNPIVAWAMFCRTCGVSETATDWDAAMKLAYDHVKDGHPVIDEFGNRYWLNNYGELHRVGKPAVVGVDGSEHWYQYGNLHRDDGPAVNTPDGRLEYWNRGRRHRIGGLAVETESGGECWVNGVFKFKCLKVS